MHLWRRTCFRLQAAAKIKQKKLILMSFFNENSCSKSTYTTWFLMKNKFLYVCMLIHFFFNTQAQMYVYTSIVVLGVFKLILKSDGHTPNSAILQSVFVTKKELIVLHFWGKRGGTELYPELWLPVWTGVKVRLTVGSSLVCGAMLSFISCHARTRTLPFPQVYCQFNSVTAHWWLVRCSDRKNGGSIKPPASVLP